jgi:hypothetical protein
MSRYDDEPFMLWFTRPTATWLELSAEARGVAISIAMTMATGQSGSLTLRKGLPSLARVVQIPWEKLEPALSELIAAGKLEWDGSRFVLFDPEYADRKRKSSADRMRDKRSKDAAKAAPAPDSPPPSSPRPRDASDARDVTSVTAVTDPPCDVSDAPSNLISSDLISDQIPEEIPSARARPAPSAPDPQGPEPEWWAGVLTTIGMDTGVHLPGRESWLRYAGHRASKAQREGRPQPATQADAVHWLATVLVPEARKAREQERRQRDRDAKFDRPRAGPPAPGDTQKITDSQAKAFAEQIRARVAANQSRKETA